MKSIFISSTFRDMQAERDMVQERVLPALREEARKYGDSVGVIDLRWGVDTSSLETEEGAAKVLKVCLDEIDRSHPYMLIFIGERYGWIPESKLIETAVYGREDKYITDDYAKSVTALEIEYGALSEKYGELDHCVICFREPVGNILDDSEKGIYIEQTEEGRRKLEHLKEKIKQDLGDDERLITYSGTWDKSARQLVDFMSDEQPLENVLVNSFVKMFQDDWKEYENLSWQEKEQLGFRALMESKLRSFVGREALLEEYYQSALNGNCPIILQGETGSGKTAIMCELIERLQKEGKNVFAFFSGAGNMSTNAETLVKQMVFYMENLLGVEEHFGAEKDDIEGVLEKGLHNTEDAIKYDDWMERLKDLCSCVPEEEKVYFCIDALDQLYPDEHVEKLDFFARGRNVKVVTTCTNEFVLPMEATFNRVVKNIPALNIEDARTVSKGILASYSRNAYAAIEEEILKKKSIGNPLYISLLIQRLNMMDTEELRRAMTEEEIVALGIGIIREMPEETEDAIVSIIRDGIDKISKEENALYEALQYLAVSRNGLRLSDLNGIFSANGRQLPALDLTLLMKYLDSFFYIHEDGRVDFTHKVIRQGLLKKLRDREAKETIIKEYLKTLDVQDGLRMREGMYFARIQRDERFAKEIIEQAYITREEELVKAIKNEAVVDSGRFYCILIETETQEDSFVYDFLLFRLIRKQLGLTKEEMLTKHAIGEALVRYAEQLHEKNRSEMSQEKLSVAYNNMGHVYRLWGQPRKALLYYEKDIKCIEIWYKRNESEKGLRELFISYNCIGSAYVDLGQAREALIYCEKAFKCGEALYEKDRSEANLSLLSSSYDNMGNIYRLLGKLREALMYCEKALEYREILIEKNESESSLHDLLISYINAGYVVTNLGQSREALSYYEKALKYAEQLHEKNGSESSLSDLSISYNNLGNAYRELGQLREALMYSEKALKCTEQLHEKIGSQTSLRNLITSYSNMGNAYSFCGQPEKALMYYENSLNGAEQLNEMVGSETSQHDLARAYINMGIVYSNMGHSREALEYYKSALKGLDQLHERRGNDANLLELSICYKNIGNIYRELEQLREALTYYERNLECAEVLYEKNGSEQRLYELSVCYNNMGRTCRELGQLREALTYYEKDLKCAEVLYEKNGSEESLCDLSVSYNKMGRVYEDLGQLKEALVYYEKDLKCAENLYEKNGNEENLRDLAITYSSIASILCDLDRYEEALVYYENSMRGREMLYRLSADDIRLNKLSMAYNNYGWTLCKVGRAADALGYLEKSLQYAEELHRKNPTQKTQIALAGRWRNIADALLGSGRFIEAIEFGKKATNTDRELYAKDTSDVAEERLMKSLSIYAEALLADKQTEDAYKVYTEAITHCKSVCEKRNSALNGRIYAKVLKGMERCLHEPGQNAETE